MERIISTTNPVVIVKSVLGHACASQQAAHIWKSELSNIYDRKWPQRKGREFKLLGLNNYVVLNKKYLWILAYKNVSGSSLSSFKVQAFYL
jgi:hypothetical protein